MHRYEGERGSTAYNIPAVMELTGELDRERFHDVFQELISRHESLRTSFLIIEDRPVQKIHNKVKFSIKYHNFSPDQPDHTENRKNQSEVFAGGPGGQFFQKEPPWPPEARAFKNTAE